MASRKELKEQRRREREAAELAAARADRRRRRLRLAGVGLAVVAAVAGVVALRLTADSSEQPNAAFAAKPEGLPGRVEEAGLQPGPDHFHPVVRTFAGDEEIPIPEDLGAAADGSHAGIHRHPGDESVHAEGVRAGSFTLGQLMTVWGVPFSSERFGPYRADGQAKVTVLVKEPGSTKFTPSERYGDLVLRDKQEVYVVFGTPEQSPIAQ